MRNPLALLSACFLMAVAIAGTWYFAHLRHADQAPQAVTARPAEPLPPASGTLAKDDIEVTAAIGSKPAAPPAPAPAAAPPALQKAACTNPDALGVGRVVEIDTSGGPGFGFEHF